MNVRGLITAGLGGGCAALVLAVLPAAAQSAHPPAQVKITNARMVPLDTLEIVIAGDEPRLVAKLAKPLAPGKSISLKLNKPAGCSYSVVGRFSDEVESDNEGVDLCRERSVRLTD